MVPRDVPRGRGNACGASPAALPRPSHVLHGDLVLHRLASDEVWHAYDGGPLVVAVIDPGDGRLEERRLGRDPRRGEAPQLAVRAGCWFGAFLPDEVAFALVGCTVAPGFDFDDFEPASRRALLERHPQHRAVIERLTAAGT
jgi:predicted cupin superfamily sugar epimerase